jgi:GT2 family glycosyltransferase
VDTLVDRLLATGAVAAGPRLVDREGKPELSFGRMLSPARELAQRVRGRLARSSGVLAGRYIRRLVGTEREVDWVSGACLLVHRAAAVEAGLFDERYFLYEEDVDLCAALRARGGRVLFTPRAEVVHARGRSVAEAGSAAASLYDRSHLAFYHKHRPGWVPVLRLWLGVRGRRIR